MEVLVTGGCGFVGQNLTKALIDLHFHVTVLDNEVHGHIKHDTATYYTGDVQDIQKILPTEQKFQLVFHLAALSRIQPSFDTPQKFFDANANGTQTLLEWVRIHSPTATVVYAGSSSRWHTPEISPYATSKIIGEQLCKMYRTTYDLNVHIARFYNVYGPGQIETGNYATVIGKWIHASRHGKPLEIVGDGQQKRDFTYVGDIVDGLLRIGNYPQRDNFQWELGSGTNYKITDVYDIFLKRFPKNTARFVPRQRGNYPVSLCTDDTAYTLLQWKPRIHLAEYIQSI